MSILDKMNIEDKITPVFKITNVEKEQLETEYQL